jgi:hypothetical protein
MTQFTSFVAVEEQTVVEGGRTRTIQVPVEVPQGVNPDTAYGRNLNEVSVMGAAQLQLAPSKNGYAMAPPPPGIAGGLAAGRGAGVGGGTFKVGSAAQSVTVDQVKELKDEDAARGDASLSRDRREAKSKAAEKLHPSLMAVYECWVRMGNHADGKCDGITNGKVKVLIQLQGNIEEGVRILKERGIETVPLKSNATSGWVTATVTMEKLDTIVGIVNVKLVALQK